MYTLMHFIQSVLVQAETMVKAVQSVQQTPQQVQHKRCLHSPLLPVLTLPHLVYLTLHSLNHVHAALYLCFCDPALCLCDRLLIMTILSASAAMSCLQASNATSASVQSRFGAKTGASHFQDTGVRASSGYAPGFTYPVSQTTQGQMNPLLMDYAGLQYPGY